MQDFKITPKEEEIMNFFWDNGPLFIREILLLYNSPKPHFNTISTIVRALEEKGLVNHNSYGSTYQYFASISRDEFKQNTLSRVINKYFDKSVLSAVSSLVEQEKISVDELKRLIAMVENNDLK